MQPQPVHKLLLSIPEVSDATDLGKTKIYELIAAGELSVVRFGRRTLVPLSALEDLIKRRTTTGGS